MFIPPHFCRPLHSAARDGRTTGPPLAMTPLYLYTHIQDRHKHKHALEKNIICGQWDKKFQLNNSVQALRNAETAHKHTSLFWWTLSF